MRKWLIFLLVIGLWFRFTGAAEAKEMSDQEKAKERMALYQKMETITQIPWYYFAGVDQYERNLRNKRKDLPDAEGLTAIHYTSDEWVGALNPNPQDKNPMSIALFGGVGMDGNGDGVADRHNPEDVLNTLASFLNSYGFDKEDIKIALWDYYERDTAVDIITGHAKVYHTFGKLTLDQHAFPVPLNANYTIKNTWGARRGWGGDRIHEGTDIFADYGVKVRATSYGIIESIGWNKYGGWRIGIRDLNNVYHYYAHMNGYEEGIKKGTVVKPGMVIGAVGSSGYGPEGTSGKFPAHLHYGMYRDLGYTEWSFDPYPYLKAWERKELQK
jgi:murein DD-endopeptidase MepM/ murein hydrolase activator NlpD